MANPFASTQAAAVRKFLSGEAAFAAILAVMKAVQAANAKIGYACLAREAGVWPRGMGRYLDRLPLGLQILVVGGDGLPAMGFWRKLEASLGEAAYKEKGPALAAIVKPLPYYGAAAPTAGIKEEDVDAVLASTQG